MLTKLDNFGRFGVNADTAPSILPVGVWSDARNIRFTGPEMEKMLEPDLFSSFEGALDDDPTWMQGWSDGRSTYVVVATTRKLWFLRRGSEEDDGTWLDVSRDDDYSESGVWDSFAWGDTVIFNNTIDPPQIYDSSAGKFVDLPNWGLISNASDISNGSPPSRQLDVSCGILRPYRNFLVAMAITENGEYQPNTVWWSDATTLATFSTTLEGGGPPLWDYPDPDNLSGKEEVAVGSGPITCSAPLNENLVIYTESATTSMQAVGGALVMSFRRLFNKGAAAAQCAVEFNNQHFVVSRDQLYVHDGSTVQLIAKDRVEEEFFRRIGKPGRFGGASAVDWQRVQVVKNPDRKEISVIFDTIGDEGEAIREALLWNFEANNFSWYDAAVDGCAGGGSVVPPQFECNSLVEYVESVSELFAYYIFADNKAGSDPLTDASGNGRDASTANQDNPLVQYSRPAGFVPGCAGENSLNKFQPPSGGDGFIYPYRDVPENGVTYSPPWITVGAYARIDEVTIEFQPDIAAGQTGPSFGSALLRIAWPTENDSEYGWAVWIDADGTLYWKTYVFNPNTESPKWTPVGVQLEVGTGRFYTLEFRMNRITGEAKLYVDDTLYTFTFVGDGAIGLTPTDGLRCQFMHEEPNQIYQTTYFLHQMWIFTGDPSESPPSPEGEGCGLLPVECMRYQFDPGWQVRWEDWLNDGTTWQDLQNSNTRWIDLYSGGKEENLYWLTKGGLYISDQRVVTDGVKSYFVERQDIDFSDVIPQFTSGRWIYSNQFYFHLQSDVSDALPNEFSATIGWTNSLMDAPNYLPATSLNLQTVPNGGVVKWDYRVTGRYLALRFDFDATQEIQMTGGEMYLEQTHGR